MVVLFLVLTLLAVGLAALYLGARARRVGAQLSDTMSVCAQAKQDLAVKIALLGEREEELTRLRAARDSETSAAVAERQRLDLVAERLKQVVDVTQGAANKSEAAQAGAER